MSYIYTQCIYIYIVYTYTLLRYETLRACVCRVPHIRVFASFSNQSCSSGCARSTAHTARPYQPSTRVTMAQRTAVLFRLQDQAVRRKGAPLHLSSPARPRKKRLRMRVPDNLAQKQPRPAHSTHAAKCQLNVRVLNDAKKNQRDWHLGQCERCQSGQFRGYRPSRGVLRDPRRVLCKIADVHGRKFILSRWHPCFRVLELHADDLYDSVLLSGAIGEIGTVDLLSALQSRR